jgi:hypothetical protein
LSPDKAVHAFAPLANTIWRQRRVEAVENNLLVYGATLCQDSLVTGHPESDHALATAKAYHEHAHTMSTISMHDQRLTRKYKQTLQMIEEVQAKRMKEEAWNLEQASALKQMHEAQQAEAQTKAKKEGKPTIIPIPYDPRCDGFVFSVAEIDHFADCQHRYRKARGFAA